MIELPRATWQQQRWECRQRFFPWVESHRQRRAQGNKHPVYDFLFTYYSCRPGRLLRWSPGLGVMLLDTQPTDTDWPNHFVPSPHGCYLGVEHFLMQRIGPSETAGQPAGRDPGAQLYLNHEDGPSETAKGLMVGNLGAGQFLKKRLGQLESALAYLEAVASREPMHRCFGLHEWAMLYRTVRVRHEQVPLRVSARDIERTVEDLGLCCTHFDAYRFFTDAAAPRNFLRLSRATASEHDQGGCLHANMDLYKFAYSILPFLPSNLLIETFELAAAAREIDMRASPYDLRSMGFEPIPVERREGREVYLAEQKRLAARARPLRQQLIEAYRGLLAVLRKLDAVTIP